MNVRAGVLLSLVVGLSAGAAEGPRQAVAIAGLEPTVLFPHGEPLMQLARLTVANTTGRAVQARARVSLAGLEAHEQPLGALPAGETTRDVRIPDISVPMKLRLELVDPQGKPLAAHETLWQPQRHWVVTIVKSAHTDLGYENYEHVKCNQLAQYVDDALEITDATWALPDASRYRWTVEHLWWLWSGLEVRPWPWLRRVVDDYIKKGKADLPGVACGVHTHWHTLEQLCHSLLWGRRHARDWLGLDLPLYLICDNPSVAWPVAQAWANAGGRYVVDCRQGWRTGGSDGFHRTRVPRVFWWVGPDRRSKVLFCYPASYGLWRGVIGSGTKGLLGQVPRRLRAIEQGRYGPYPYDLWLAPAYMDHSPPRKDESDAVVEWNKRWRYPELRIDGNTAFMAAMERRYGDRIPTLTGDMNNYSADYAAIDSDTFGVKRQAGTRLAVAESVASVARLLDPRFALAQRRIDDAYWRLCAHDDHTWPTGPAPNDFQETNTVVLKTHNARVAAAVAADELGRGLEAIAARIPCRTAPTVVVLNPLAHPRTDVVAVPLAKLGGKADGLALIDNATGKQAPCQDAGNGRLVLLARDLPPFGYKTYAVRRAASRLPQGGLKATATSLESRFYRIALDPKTGTIASLLDKQLGRELVDKAAPHRLNQVIYDHRIGRLSTAGYQASPTEATLTVERIGPVFATVRVETAEPRSGAQITQRVTLYRDLKRVDLTTELREVRAIWGDARTFSREWGKVGPRYKDNMFVAFPLHVPDATIRAEYAIGTVRPYDDQLRLGSHDFLSVQHYVDCSNADYGVTWTTREAPVVHFGAIRYNQFSNTYKPRHPWLYSYAMSNRLAGLLWHHPSQVRATLHYTLTSHAGAWPKGDVARTGWERGNPLAATVLGRPQQGSLPAGRQSFVQVDAPNVQMAVLRPSAQPGRGFVLRLIETDAKPQTAVRVRFGAWRLAKAVVCNLVEDDGEPLPLDADGRGVRLTMGRHEVTTLRLVPTTKAPAKVAGLRAEAVSDKAIRLSWQPVPGAASYNVYRLPAAGEPAVLYSLAGETTRTEFVDDWLSLDAACHYRVAAVAPGNVQGPPSDEVAARTRKENLSPPAPVRELVLVERGSRRVLVTWRTSKEPDVAGYEVYRGERPDSPLDAAHRIHAVAKPAPHYRQLYADTGVEPKKSYHYRVLAVDAKGRRSPTSPLASITVCDDPPPPRKGTVEDFPGKVSGQLRSKALGRNVRYSLWVPKAKAPPGGWPLLLVLHSNGRHCDSLIEQHGVLDTLFNVPFAVGFADGGTHCWIDSPVKPQSRYHSMVVELIGHMARKHKVGLTPERRAVTGWSVGGYGAFLLAARHPELVGGASAMIGLLDLPRTPPKGACSTALFGEKGTGWEPLLAVPQAAKLRGKALAIFTSSDGLDLPHNKAMHDALAKAAIAHHYEAEPGMHDMAATLRMWPKVVAFHANVWRKPAAPPSKAR